MNLQRLFPTLLEKAIDWASDTEASVLESGRELTSEERIDARLAGVSEPARIRLLVVPALPMPEDELLASANRQLGVIAPETQGLALGYAVMVREGVNLNRRLFVHEFTHVAQYERYGGIDGFLREYLTELLTVGYHEAPLETEAIRRSDAVVGPLKT